MYTMSKNPSRIFLKAQNIMPQFRTFAGLLGTNP